MENTLSVTIRYARGDGKRLDEEKPYILTYPVDEKIPWSNFDIEFYSGIELRSLREASLKWEESGLKLASLEGSMAREDFYDNIKIEQAFLPSIYKCIRDTLGAKEIHIFDYMIRRRNPAFPYHPPTQDKVPQPALSAHIDYTEAEINERLANYFGAENVELLKKRHFQAVKWVTHIWDRDKWLTPVYSIWKPLRGPLRDYPLAYCDASSVNQKTDLMITDEVFPKMASEIYQVLYNPAHKWYWIPDQMEDEVVLFVGYDSLVAPRLAVPHCSVDLGELSEGDPRESIEVRALVFYD